MVEPPPVKNWKVMGVHHGWELGKNKPQANHRLHITDIPIIPHYIYPYYIPITSLSYSNTT